MGIDGGDFGDDSILVAYSRIGGDLFVRLGEGDDQLGVIGTTVVGDAVFNGEDGRDSLAILASRFGSRQISNFEYQFPRS